MRYKIIKRSSLDLLSADVNEYLKLGWKPIGGVCYIPETITRIELYAQALIKESM